jgi:hypothetical protein
VGSPHVRVGHRQASNPKSLSVSWQGFFYFPRFLVSVFQVKLFSPPFL